MAQEIYMDVPAVRKIGGRFGEFGDQLTNLNELLELTILAMRATSFKSMFSELALAEFLESLQPMIEQYAELCREMSEDLSLSAEAYENGDELGSAKFHI